ncbi:MAG: protein kinase [Planctomycetes bacterium]|nr:protein kinase [Planctomycetota bacterium]
MGMSSPDDPQDDGLEAGATRTAPPGGRAAGERPATAGPQRIGNYLIEGELGRGAMGTVYAARQAGLDRRVALKVITAEAWASAAEVERFRREARMVAGLRHPGIVAVHEVGQDGELHYFTMDLVAGKTLAELIRSGELPLPRVLALIEAVAEAVAHAHTHGVVHRDLKPANVIVQEGDRPVVMDFGLARDLTAQGGLTQSGQGLGTPYYMPPEQWEGELEAIGPASDVYALGAVLYEALTSAPPFVGATLASVRRQCLDRDPVSPRLLNGEVDRDLETICLKCLEKDPKQRYLDAGALLEDLRRRRDARPIAARPAGPLERALKFARRHRAPVVVAAGAALLLAAVITVAFVRVLAEGRAARRAEGVARTAEGQARASAERAQASLARALRERGELLLGQSRAQEAWATLAQALQVEEDLRTRWLLGRARDQAPRLIFSTGPGEQLVSLAASPDGRWLAVSANSKEVTVYGLRDMRRVVGLATSAGGNSGIAFAAAGDRLWTAGNDNVLRGWDVPTWAPRPPIDLGEQAEPAMGLLALGPDGDPLAVALRHGRVRLRDPRTGTFDRVIQVDFRDDGTDPYISALALDPSGTLLATTGYHGPVRLWTSEGRPRGELPVGVGFKPDSWVLAFDPGGRRLAAIVGRTSLVIHDLDRGVEVLIRDHPHGLNCVAFSPDGARWAAGDNLGQLLLGASGGGEVEALQVAPVPVRALAFDPAQPQRLALAYGEGGLALWDLKARRPLAWGAGHPFGLRRLVWCGQDEIASVGGDQLPLRWRLGGAAIPELPTYGSPRPSHIRDWDISPDLQRGVRPIGDGGLLQYQDRQAGTTESIPLPFATATEVALEPGGRWLAAGSKDDPRVLLWELPGLRPAGNLDGHLLGVRRMAFSPSGRSLAVAAGDRQIYVWDLEKRTRRATLEDGLAETFVLAYRSDGKLLASGGADRNVRLWDASGKLRARLPGHGASVRALDFSPDGASLAVGCDDGRITIWDIKAEKLRQVILAHRRPVTCLAFDPEGRRLASGSDDRTMRVWGLEGARGPRAYAGHLFAISTLAFDPSGTRLASASNSGEVRVQDLEGHARWFAASGSAVLDLAFSPDGRHLAWTQHGPRVVVAPLEGEGAQTILPAGGDRAVFGVAWSRDGGILAAACDDRRLRTWRAGAGWPPAAEPLPAEGWPYQCLEPAERPQEGFWVLGGQTEAYLSRLPGPGLLARLPAGHDRLSAAAFDPERERWALGHDDGHLRLGRVGATEGLELPAAHAVNVLALAFDPRGRLLCSTGADGTAVLWDLALAQGVGVLDDASGKLRAASFSPDGRWLATGGEDRTLRLYDLAVLDTPRQRLWEEALQESGLELVEEAWRPQLVQDLVWLGAEGPRWPGAEPAGLRHEAAGSAPDVREAERER